MSIKKGDKIQVIAGKDKGKTGTILQAFPEQNKFSVDGVNLAIKHLRPPKKGEKGQRIEFSAPMSASNLLLFCSKCKKGVRVGTKIIEKNNKQEKQRICKKCGTAI